MIDVSTLGKIAVIGPEAAAFLERLYPEPLRRHEGWPHPLRRPPVGRRAGSWTTARSRASPTYYVTTTSTGAGAVLEWFEWWNAVWGMDAEIVNVAGALAAVNVAGPRCPRADAEADGHRRLERGAVVSRRAAGSRRGRPCLVLRIGFVGELGYELHLASPYGEYLWDTILQRGEDLGIRPFGLEPQRVLRLEKMHILVGQDTDSESNVLEASMPWIAKFDKEDFSVGARARPR